MVIEITAGSGNIGHFAYQVLTLAREDDFVACGLLAASASMARNARAHLAANTLTTLANGPEGVTDEMLATLAPETARDIGAAISAAFLRAKREDVPFELRDDHAALVRMLAVGA